MPLASGVRARATSVLERTRSASVASMPTAENIRRSVFRWSMAMMEKTPFGAAMSASVRTGLVVTGMKLLLDRACRGLGQWCCRDRSKRQDDGAGNAGLGHVGELQALDHSGLGPAHARHPGPATAGHGPSMRPDDLMDGVQQAAGLGRGVAGGGRPDGCRAGVVTKLQDDVVTGGPGAGDVQPGRQRLDGEGGLVETVAGGRLAGTEQGEGAAQQQAAANAAEQQAGVW